MTSLVCPKLADLLPFACLTPLLWSGHNRCFLYQPTHPNASPACCAELQGMLAQILDGSAAETPPAAALLLDPQHMGQALAEVQPLQPPLSQGPPQLLIQLPGLPSAQHGAAFCLLLLRQAQLSGSAVAWASLSPLSTALAWCAVHGGLTLRTAALQAFSATPLGGPNSPLHSLPQLVRFLQAHQACERKVDGSCMEAAAWWAAWCSCLQGVLIGLRQHSCVGGTTGPGGLADAQAAARQLLCLLVEALKGGSLAGVCACCSFPLVGDTDALAACSGCMSCIPTQSACSHGLPSALSAHT